MDVYIAIATRVWLGGRDGVVRQGAVWLWGVDSGRLFWRVCSLYEFYRVRLSIVPC